MVSPSSGVAFNTTFSIAASEFIDSQLPLSYFFTYQRNNDLNPIYLSQLSISAVLSTRLASTNGAPAVVTGTCVDFLGAMGYAGANVTVAPLYVPGVSACSALPNVTAIILGVQQAGGSIDDVVRTLQVLADSASATLSAGLNQSLAEQQCLQVRLVQARLEKSSSRKSQSALADGGIGDFDL